MKRPPLDRHPLNRARVLLKAGAAATSISLLTGAVVVSCSGDPAGAPTAPENRPDSAAMGQWDQRFDGACTKAMHDGYYVIGPDGRKYPTWHAPTDIDPATGLPCSYGHEHGENPAGAALWNDLRRHFAWDADGNGTIAESEWNNDRSGVPFGYVSEQYSAFVGRAGAHAHEHRSYRMHYVNGLLRQRLVNGQPQDYDLSCDHFVAFSHDTASTAALANNLHAITWALDCNRGSAAATYAPKLIVSVLAAFGEANRITGEDGGALIDTTGTAVLNPAERVDPLPARGAEAPARRLLPVTDRVFGAAFVPLGATSDLVAALEERWDAVVSLTSGSGVELARINPGLVTRDPSRWFSPSTSGALRSIDLCYSGLNAAGQLVSDPLQVASILRQVRGNTDCALLDPTGPATAVTRRIAFDTSQARFKGCARQWVLRDQSITNGSGPSTWHTDPLGRNGRSTPFTGSVRQFIAPVITGSTIVLARAIVDEAVDCGVASGVRVAGN